MVKHVADIPPLSPLTPLQKCLLMDESHRFLLTPAGRRSRKTLIGSRKVLIRALRSPMQRIFEGAPTRSQAKAIFWERLKRETKFLRKKEPNETDLIVTLLNGTEIHVVGLDKPQRIEGQPWHGMHITEMADVKARAWSENLRPLLSDTNGWAYLDGVPEGRGDWYDMCLLACGGKIPQTLGGVGTYVESKLDPEWAYYHWHSADVLPSKEIEAVKRTMDIATFEQEYEGSFQSGEGLAYYPFGDENLNTREDDPELPLHIGMDFNYDPMCSTVAQEYVKDGMVIPQIIASNGYRNCDTAPACNRLIDQYGEARDYIIYPDPACQSRGAHGEGGKTDLIIIKQSFQRVVAAGGSYKICVRPVHPMRKDRMNAVNTKLRNALKEIGMWVDPRCQNLIKDLQKVTREEFLNNNFSDPQLGHVSDALGYYIEYQFPMVGGPGIGGHHVT